MGSGTPTATLLHRPILHDDPFNLGRGDVVNTRLEQIGPSAVEVVVTAGVGVHVVAGVQPAVAKNIGGGRRVAAVAAHDRPARHPADQKLARLARDVLSGGATVSVMP
jgi:hypothetical protein